MANFSSIVHLRGRYPVLGQNEDFFSWLNKHDAEVWHETLDKESNLATVVVQSRNRMALFAALIHYDISRARDGIIKHEILHTTAMDLSRPENTPHNAVILARNEIGDPNAQIHALRPVVDFTSPEPILSWDVEINDTKSMQNFRFENPDRITRSRTVDIKIPEARVLKARPVPLLMNDWLGDNECHHLAVWRPLAQQLAAGAASIADAAYSIWLGVAFSMQYDANIAFINEFTWSDNLTINYNNWRGVCDEWAVVQVTFLRALGIPAVMKFLTWEDPAQGLVGHACVEWSDNGIWRHMDALWYAFDDRAIYRKSGGAINIHVMDADYPLDGRYSGLAWGVPDMLFDERFYPYGDWIIRPAYPGNPRSGYSY